LKSNQSKRAKNPCRRKGAGALAREVTAYVTAHGMSRKEARTYEFAPVVSIATERITRGVITRVVRWLRTDRNKDWHQAIGADFTDYLIERSGCVKQATLDVDRLAIERVTRKKVEFAVSTVPTIQVPRAYSNLQIEVLSEVAEPRLALSLRICGDSGVRAEELLTLGPTTAIHEDTRPWVPDRFAGRSGAFEIFCVVGKGGLKRRVAVRQCLAVEIKSAQLASPRIYVDRELRLKQYFDLLGGQNFSQAFSSLSMRALGFSNGGHGLRYSFAQRRLHELQLAGLSWDLSLDVLTQELGHFSQTNTLTYLR